jgi:outer membrane receptor protein involved in Fe transport
MKTQWMYVCAASLLACSISQALAQQAAVPSQQNTAASNNASNNNPQNDQEQNKPKKLKIVQVTGSLIPQAQIEGSSPVTTITAKDIEKQGFVDTYDALRSLPVANGSVQDPQFTGGYTPAAKTISLFGLSPDFTLTLLNGRPMASYPLAYNGSLNITDISNIPVGLIDRIDVLTGGASSIYGSAAIAGVVNIVLKDHVEGTHIGFRYGTYSEGGGASKRLQISSGHTWGKLDVSGGVQLSKENPIWGYQRSYIDSQDDDPDVAGRVNSRSFLRLNSSISQYIDPGADTCAPLSYLYRGSTTYSYRPGLGYYCGSPKNVGNATLSNDETDANGLLQLRYHINDHTTLYADTLYSYSNPTYVGGSPFWNNTFYNQTSGQYEEWQRIFAPEEAGSNAGEQHVFTKTYNVSIGVRGELFDNWNYDAYYNRSQTDLVRKSRDFLANNGVDQYYLGPQLGFDSSGYPIYAPNLNRLYQPITPALYNQFTAVDRAASTSWTQNETFTANTTSLFSLPAGDVGAALIAQTSNQRFANASASPLATEGYFRGVGGTTTAGGASSQFAFGGELQVPLFKQLTADVSARFDKYDYGGRGHGRPTYKLGLEYRPFDTLLVRASAATAFRAPDLFYLFSAHSSGYSTNTDYYKCRVAGYNPATYGQCPYNGLSILAVTSGNTNLMDITAKTYTAGFVWSTSDNRLSWSVDYDIIRVNNEVVTLSTDQILSEEANCRLGVSDNGEQTYDINSPTCQQVIGEVQRYPATDPINANVIKQVSTYPINVASEYQTGIQSSVKYRLETDNFGSFQFGLDYYDELKHTYQEKSGDPTLNYLCCNNNDEFKSRVNGTVTWNIGKWSSTIYGLRNGNTWNYAGTGPKIGPWITFNGSVGYKVTPKTTVSVTANNMFNKRPPMDNTNSGWPYFDVTDYSALGRSVYLDIGFDLGI